mgnify:CR=1 FL=1
MRRLMVATLVVGLILFAGCTNMKKYDPLMNDAQKALEAAKEAGAAEFAPEDLAAAEENFKKAREMYESKKGSETEEYANKTIESADKAKNAALAAKKEAERIITVKSDYEQKLSDLEKNIDQIKGYPEYQKTLDLIEQAKAEFEAGEYDKALKTLQLAWDTYNKGLETKNNLPVSYTVVKGDCLWNIAKKPVIYGDPFKWPKIYRANKDKIRDPDLIYPRQVFKIPRN